MALELVPTSRGMFGSDIPQGNTGQSRYSIPEQSRFYPRCSCPSKSQIMNHDVEPTISLLYLSFLLFLLLSVFP